MSNAFGNGFAQNLARDPVSSARQRIGVTPARTTVQFPASFPSSVPQPGIHLALVGLRRSTRMDRGLTHKVFADLPGRPQSCIAKIKRHERRSDGMEFLEITHALGVPPADLLDRVQAAIRQVRRTE